MTARDISFSIWGVQYYIHDLGSGTLLFDKSIQNYFICSILNYEKPCTLETGLDAIFVDGNHEELEVLGVKRKVC